MTMTTEPGLAGLQARTQAELAPRLMAQLQRLNWDADRLAAHQADPCVRCWPGRSKAPRSTPAASGTSIRPGWSWPTCPACRR